MKKLLTLILVIGVLVCICTILFFTFFQTLKVYGFSMIETYKNGEYLQVLNCKLIFAICNVQRADVIVANYQDVRVLGRVIGTGGDKLRIENGKVILNGNELSEPYLANKAQTFLPISNWMQEGVEYTVPENNYFVLGDNRGNSKDSRFSDVKYITKENILYKVIGKY